MSNFLQIFIHGKFVKKCLWTSIGSACYSALCHDTGSACCFSMDSKQGLVCKAVFL